ncbi:MAG: hypothetical protein MJ182_07675 [Treponema sp.]|nr:hypothetical protein [Treponema sp.]
MSDKLKKLLAALLFAFLAFNVVAATPDLAGRFLEKADTAYDDGDIDGAYKYINQALALTKNDPNASNVTIFAQTVYKTKLNQIMNNYDELDFIDVTSNLEQYPSVASASIKKLVAQIEAMQTQKIEAEKKAAQEKQQAEEARRAEEQTEIMRKQAEESRRLQEEANEETRKANAENRRLQEEANAETRKANEENLRIQKANSEELKNTLSSGLQVLGDGLEKSSTETRMAINKIVWIVILIVVLIFFIVLVIMVIARKSFKQAEIQQEQYVQAFRMLAASQNQTNRLMLGGVTDLYGAEGSQLRLAGSSRWAPAALPDVEQSPEEQEELRTLASKCEDLGAKIDQATGRKNNSKNVSELCYKIAMALGLPQGESMLYFCAAMVYDAGFLSIDPEIMAAENLTDEQRKLLREHVNMSEKPLEFVPKRYWQTFEDAAKWHHENMDGSGYPKGLKGDKIPQIARLIRVCESYISMISRRNYREIYDKETAVEKLREKPEFYDSDVIDVLETII